MSDIKEYKCPNCGAPLKYNIETQKMVCIFCANTYDLDYIRNKLDKATDEKLSDFDWAEHTKNDLNAGKTQKLVEYSCPSCGGSIITFSNRTKAKCPYCNNDLIASTGFKGDIRPDKVIPFSKTAKDFADEYRKRLSEFPAVPYEFKDNDIEKRIVGRYIPIWLYNCSCNATRIDSSKIEFKIKDYPIPAAKFDNTVFYEIEPFNYDDAENFTESCLTGFYAGRYTISAEKATQDAYNEIEEYALWNTEFTANRKHIYKTPDMDFTINEQDIKYFLVPVWLLEIKYRAQTYTFAMNGQTGEFFGGELFSFFQKELAKRGYNPSDLDSKKSEKSNRNSRSLFFAAIIIAPILLILFFKLSGFKPGAFSLLLFLFLAIFVIPSFLNSDTHLINNDPFKYITPPRLRPIKRTIPYFVCDEKMSIPAPESDNNDNKPAE